MDSDFSALDEHIDKQGVDGYLLDASSEEPDQYYLSGFDAPDPYVTLYNGSVHLLFQRGLEYGRATREARAETVHRGAEYGLEKKREEYGVGKARDSVIAAFLADHGVESVATPPRFPLRTADGLRDQDIEVVADDRSAVEKIRATKTETERNHIREAQRANEAAMARAEELLAGATVSEDGQLHHEGDVLTSEAIKQEIEMELLRHGCGLDDTIVACGRDAADPHDRGSGPLVAGEPVIVDIFPRHKETHYFADMTRTFCKGEPADTVREWYDLTLEAQAAALAAVGPGVSAQTVHDAACDVYEDADLPTLRSDEAADTGFIHSTGHGLGLAIHEQPGVSTGGPELKPGHVITIEPGLYDPEVGGVRIEDLVVITEDGSENLTEYHKQLVV